MKKIFLFTVTVGLAFFHSSSPAAEAPNASQVANRVLGEPRQMTFVGPRAGEGYFSADGKLLTFQSEREPENPFYQIYILNRETGKTVRVSPGVGKTTCSWIHPSKTKALFSSTHLDPLAKEKALAEYVERKNPVKGKYSWSYDETFDLFEAPIESALKTGKPVDPKSLKRLTTERGYDAEGSYSPDGRKIAFASNRAGYTENLNDEEKKIFAQDPSFMMDIYLMNADGGDVERLTTARGYDGGPFFSPDGKMITWRRFAPNGQTAEIMVMDLKTRKEKQLTHMKAMSWAPFFHPSGDYLVFTTNKLGYSNFELFIVDVEGKNEPVRVSFLDGFDGLPVFTPDGKELAWTRKDEKGESQIYIASWDDGWARSLLGLGRSAPRMSELAKEIREEDARAWVSYLAGAPLKGRKPGTVEERTYADAIGRYMKSIGLEPATGKNFAQAFEFTSGITLGPLNRMRMREAGAGLDLKVETEWMPLSISKSGDVPETSLVFAGYGIVTMATEKIPTFDSYEGLDVAGKWVVALRDLPNDITPEKRFQYHLSSRPQNKALVAKQKGAVGLILIDPPGIASPKDLAKLKFEGASEVGIPVIHVSRSVAEKLFVGAKTKLKDKMKELDQGAVWNEPLATSIGGKIDLQLQKSTALNIVGRLRGTAGGGKTRDGASGRGPLVIGAHGDHLGFGESGASLAKENESGQIHYGADDNASGVAALLEIAQEWSASAAKKRPDRDIVFAVWSAEELGVLGSTHFLKEWKAEKPVAYVNMDMVGRLRESLTIQGVGSASELKPMIEAWAGKFSMPVTTTADPYLPTDAMPFYMHEIPILSFFTGAHAEYHSPRDRYETLNFKGLVETAKAVSLVAHGLAQASTKLAWLKVESGKGQGGTESRTFRLYLGTVPDYSQDGIKGVKISGTSKDSPAETAGLKPGDVIVGLGGIKIDSIYDYVYCLQALKADVSVPMRVVRGGQALELTIVPRLKSGS